MLLPLVDVPALRPCRIHAWCTQVRVKTSDIRGAGTDANVTLAMFGKLEERNTCIAATKLDNSANNFERGMIDTFMIKGTDLGDLTHIVVRTHAVIYVHTCCVQAAGLLRLSGTCEHNGPTTRL